MIPTFVIFLREGIEASMIVAILLAYLDRMGQRRHFRDVFLGVGAAAVLLVGGGIAAYAFIHQYRGSTAQTVFETVTYLLAACVLTYMTFWMQAHSRTMSAELERRSAEAMSGKARFGLGVLSFQAVGREGVETMVFTLAIVFASSNQSATTGHGRGLLLGALAGLAVAFAVAFAIFKLGRRLNLGLFFRVLGIVLMIFAAGLLADAVENMQQLGWLPFLGHTMWNTTGILAEDSSLGDVFHSLVGYAGQPSALQVLVWVVYVATSLTLFIRLGRRRSSPAAASPAVSSAVVASPAAPADAPAGEVTSSIPPTTGTTSATDPGGGSAAPTAAPTAAPMPTAAPSIRTT
jgi:high-affinity iron transporter